MTVFYKSQQVANLLGISLPEVRDLSDVGKLTTKLEDGEMLVAADSLIDLADDDAFSFLKNRFPAFAKSRGLGSGSFFSVESVANLLGVDNTGILDMINAESLGAAVSDDEQMVAGNSLRNLIIGNQYEYGSLIPSLGDFTLNQIGLNKVSGFGIPSVADHLGLGLSSLRALIDRKSVKTIFDEGNEYVEAESLNQYVQNEPAYADSKYKLGDFIFSQLGFDVAPDPSLSTQETEVSTGIPDVPNVDGGIGLGEGVIGAGIAGVAGAVGATAAGLGGKLPDIDLPDVPDINVPDVNLPQVDFPDVDLPDVDIDGDGIGLREGVIGAGIAGVVGAVGATAAGLGDKLPDVDLPDVNVPGVGFSRPNVPDLPNVPDVDVDIDQTYVDAKLPDVDMNKRIDSIDGDFPDIGLGDVGPPRASIPDVTPDMGLPSWLRPILLVALALFAFLILLQGCGGDTDDAVSSEPVPTPVVANRIGDDAVAAVDAEPTRVPLAPGELVPTVPSTLPTRAPATRTPVVRELDSLTGTLGDLDSFSTLVGALSATDLISALEGEGPFTVFAPINSAFKGSNETIESLTEDQLREVLTYHVIEGKVMAEDVVGLNSATTLQGDDINITVEDGNVFVNDAMVIGTDVEAENGVIHFLDNVLVPASLSEGAGGEETPVPVPVAETDPDPGLPDTTIAGFVQNLDSLSTLSGALSATGLASVLDGDGPFTVFAPANSAWPEGTLESLSEDQLREVLTYHVVEGKVMAEDVVGLDSAATLLGEEINITVEDGSVFINDAKVIVPDIEVANGVIHLLDNVLLPESLVTPTEEPTPTTTSAPDTIANFVQNLDLLSTLSGALDTTGLSSALEGDGPFTLFAPTDDAFAALPEGTLESLSEDQLRDILLYHVVEGEVTSDVVVGLDSGTTLLGEDFNVTVDGSNVLINDSRVIVPDVQFANGVVHVVGGVLLPPSLTAGTTDGDGTDGDGTDGDGTDGDGTDGDGTDGDGTDGDGTDGDGTDGDGTDGDGTDGDGTDGDGTDGDGTDGDGTDGDDTAGASDAAANVHIIMDASWSMTLPPNTNDESQRLEVDDPNNRISLAREALVDLVTNVIPDGTSVGLRAFGNVEGDYSCRTDLMAVPGVLGNSDLAELITQIEPQFNANTPLADSIAAIPADIANLEGRTVVILLTDGAETCFGEPGTAAVGINASSNDIELNIVGLSIDDDGTRTNLSRIAEIGAGSYYDVADIDELSAALRSALE